MSAKVISLGQEKGGSGKTTTSGVTAYLLSLTHRVLVIDMDSQGNVFELLTGIDSLEMIGRGTYEAIKEGDVSNYRTVVNDNLHVVAGHSDLARFSRWLWSEYKGDKNLALKKALEPVMDQYDYVIIDTPPALGDQTINALAASTHVCAVYEPSKYCHSALSRFLNTVEAVKAEANPDLELAGIVISIIERRRTDNTALLELVQEEYTDVCFNTIIYRNAAAGRLAINGFIDNSELTQAVKQYKPLVCEVIERCQR